MTIRLKIPAATWPLADQAVLSLGTFLNTIVLARLVSIVDYGHFAMLLGAVLLFQSAIGSMFFYPMSVYAAMAEENERRQLIATALVVSAIFGVPFALSLSAIVGWTIQADLLFPTAAVLVGWLFQEAQRRGLLAYFRYPQAMIGDVVSYLGQVVLLVAYSQFREVTITTALYLMAVTSFAGGTIQLIQVAPWRSRPLPLSGCIRQFWSIGQWSLASNVLNVIRTQSVPWLLTAIAGAGVAGTFQAAVNIVNVINPVVFGLCTIIPQVAARASVFGNSAALRAARPYMVSGLYLVGAAIAAMIIWPREITTLIYGQIAQAGEISAVVPILAIAALLGYFGTVFCAYLHGIRHGQAGFWSDVAATLLQAIAMPPLIYFNALAGSCLAMALSSAFRAGLMTTCIYRLLGKTSASVPAVSPISAASENAEPTQP